MTENLFPHSNRKRGVVLGGTFTESLLIMAAELGFSVLSSQTPQQVFCIRFLRHSAPPAGFKPSCAQSSAVHPRVVLRSASKSKSSSPASTRGNKKSRNKDGDAWESLFELLEKDLDKDTDDAANDNITEEDVVKFEKELDSVLMELSDVPSSSNAGTISDLGDALSAENEEFDDEVEDTIPSVKDKVNENANKYVHDEEMDYEGNDDDEFDEDEFDVPREVRLERWQLRKLAAAAELGRRKVNIKSLAAELQLDRADVISFLKAPPPELLLIGFEEPEEEDANRSEERIFPLNANAHVPRETADLKKIVKKATGKGNSSSRDWFKKKRFRKEHLETFERVYSRTRRPTNAMIQNIVQLTNLPRSRILEWFENRRLQSGSKGTLSSSKEPWRSQTYTDVTSFSRSRS